MFDANRQSKMSSPAATASRDLDVIVKWLRELSAAEIKELSEALANHDALRLARYETWFEACHNRSGPSHAW